MQINTNGKRNITLDFDAPKKFKLKKDGAEIPYIRTGKNSFRLGRNIDGVLDLEEIIEQPRIVKPMQLQAQQMALVNPNDVLMINQAAQQLEVEQNLLSETQKRVEQTQAYLDIQQQRINESILSVQGLETDNSERITATENGIFNLAGELAKAEGNSTDADNYIISELDEHKTVENPHGITKETIGLNKVDNTSDLDKPISKAVQSALDEKADKDEIQAIRDELGEYQEKNDRFTNALSNYTGGLAGNQLPDGGSTGQILAKRSDMSGDAEWVDSSASITVDAELSLTSENPVQNKVITSNITALQTSKQDTLVSGTNIKTINNTSILGSGNIDIQGGGSYTAGTGIDITNDVIKVTNDISTGASLGATAIQPADLASVATSGSYNDLSNKPTIPTVNNAALTIQKNGSDVATFTANASSNVTANISVPTVDQTYSASSINAQSGVAVASAISTKADSSTVSDINSRVTTIESEIPAQASSSNQLADKNFVNSSIATNTANFIGTFNSVAELEAYSGQKDDNDYAFVISTDAAGNTLYNRYKWNGTAWLFEYALNNSSFTANQWAAINSGATTTNIGQIAINTSDIAGKQDIISDLATIRSGASAGATAVQPVDLNNTLAALYPVGAIYIGTQSTCPLATLISGSTWELVSAGRVLQGADSGHAAGTTIEAGLPNITGGSQVGYISGTTWPLVIDNPTGAFYSNGTGISSYSTTLGDNLTNGLSFDASRSNSIYGNSNTVQPPAYVVNIWRRTA